MSKVIFSNPQSSLEGTYYRQAHINDEVINAPFKGAQFVVEVGKTSKLDNHQVKECWYISKGHGELSINNTKMLVKEGDMVFFNSFETHQIVNTGNEDIVLFSIWWNHE